MQLDPRLWRAVGNPLQLLETMFHAIERMVETRHRNWHHVRLRRHSSAWPRLTGHTLGRQTQGITNEQRHVAQNPDFIADPFDSEKHGQCGAVSNLPQLRRGSLMQLDPRLWRAVGNPLQLLETMFHAIERMVERRRLL